jgi:hypothetical protein
LSYDSGQRHRVVTKTTFSVLKTGTWAKTALPVASTSTKKPALLKVFHDLEKAQGGGADAEDKTARGVSRRGVIRRRGPSLWPDEEYHDEEMNDDEVFV